MDLLINIPPYTYSIAFVLLFLLTLLYIFWDEHQLRVQIRDVRPERQTDFLIRKFRYRSITLLFILGLIFGSLSYLIDDLRTKLESIHVKARKPAEIIISPSVGRIEEKKEEPPAPVQQRMGPSSSLPLSSESDDAVLDLFEDSGETSHDLSLDGIKKRYESALIGSYILHHCNRASEDEIEVLLQALREDVMNHQAYTHTIIDPQTLYANIVTAAEGSFQIIYNHTQCDTAEVDMLEQQYANFVMQYKAKQLSSRQK